MKRPSAAAVAAAQAGYYVPTAIAPFISRRGFEAVTGRKREWWLVLTVSVLVGVIGAALGVSARRRTPTPEIALLGAGSAAGLAAIDVVYVARRRIAPSYLLDAALQLGLLGSWLIARPARRPSDG